MPDPRSAMKEFRFLEQKRAAGGLTLDEELRLAELREARARGVDLPVTALVNRFYADVQAMGGGRWDTSSLLARLKNN